MRLTAQNLVRLIGGLPREVMYQYVNSTNRAVVVIQSVQEPEGPILFKRFNPTKGETLQEAAVQSISTEMIWRMANSILPGRPVNVDRVFGGSYNSRSVIEALLAHTSVFYMCRPDRISQNGSLTEVKRGHKHLLYLPEKPRVDRKITWEPIDIQVSEVAIPDVAYQGIDFGAVPPNREMNIEQQRRHAQIQVALVLIGQYLGFRTWIAANDHSIQYAGRRLVEMPGVIPDLANERVMAGNGEGARAAHLIDCIWFRNGRLMPAVMEIEHSTGVASGLTRMKGFYDLGPQLRDIRWTIVAPDEDRQKVFDQANRPQFRQLDTRYFPYSAVEELYSLCERRRPKGITDEFLDSFMERCITQ
jgi:hypothetical protein